MTSATFPCRSSVTSGTGCLLIGDQRPQTHRSTRRYQSRRYYGQPGYYAQPGYGYYGPRVGVGIGPFGFGLY